MKRRSKSLGVNPKAQDLQSPPAETFSKSQRSQHGSRLAPTLRFVSWVSERSTVDNLMEFHMTVQSKVTNLTPKQISMLLKVCCVKAIYFGVDLGLYLSMEYLASRLRKSGTESIMMKNEKDRRNLLISDLILTSIRGEWLTLEDRELLSEEIRTKINSTGWMPNERTIKSWDSYWELNKFLKIRTVPIEHLIERQPSTSERYSGYIRGYGQDGSPPAPHRPKEESLDGNVDSELPDISLLDFDEYLTILNSIEIMKARKKQQ